MSGEKKKRKIKPGDRFMPRAEVVVAIEECYALGDRATTLLYGAGFANLKDRHLEVIEEARVQFVLALDLLDSIIRPISVPDYKA